MISFRRAEAVPAPQYHPAPGNRLTLYTDGDRAFEAAYDAIRNATDRVWLETYIFEPDEVGNMARDALAEAALRGCSVILLFDRWGSPKIGLKYARPIVEAGGRVAVYNPVLPWKKIGRKIAPVFYRDHRKILITDEIAFCGGANVSIDYGGPGPELFFDLTLKIDGPCVQDLAAVFLESLEVTAGGAPPVPVRPKPNPGGSVAQVLVLNRRRKKRDLDLALQQALDLASKTCFIMTPYFVPPDWFNEGLIAASRRGVDVRLMTAGLSDVPLARIAGRHLYTGLLEAGVRVFELKDPVLHAKSITIDGRYSIVGSYNVDAYGGKYNLEVGVSTTERELANQLEREFERRTLDSDEIDLETRRRLPMTDRVVEAVFFRLLSV
ncbi:MAG TPA: phosphatidylserine/phosphatidylglycerophosphate/cardiolipin synthase family protein [Rhodothermales bacterium]|nr:phosphatidylserine/phosphatidylglycerophosphate/cardiolipin synthase family protein [Rhodothermales bacterium]